MTKKINAEWVDDCQGKKDFDATILRISTRYWPENYQVNKMCSAKSAIELVFKETYWDEGCDTLITKEFEAPTESEVKQ